MSQGKIAVAFLSIAGSLALAWGSYIPAKAAVAQLLLNRAWEETLATGERVKPWGWADTWPVARLSIAGETYIVLADAGGQSLAFGPSHVSGTALPGEAGTSVISAHRDTQFSGLAELEPGDRVTVEGVDGEIHDYRVWQSLVLSEPVLKLPVDSSGRRLVLVTCWPIGALDPSPEQRYAVLLDEVEQTSAQASR